MAEIDQYILYTFLNVANFLFLGYCGLQLSQAVPYTSPDSFELNSLDADQSANVS